MKLKTSITHITPEGHEIIRGKNLDELIATKTFTESIVLILLGKLPTEKELKMWNALFVAAIDHGPGTASALTARISASAKNNLHTSLAAGLLGLGERHGLAIEGAMKFFLEKINDEDIASTLKKMKEQKIYAPGFGHKVLTVDTRVEALFTVAKEQGIFGKYCEFALKVHEELNKISSRPLPLNIDGGMAAILCDMDIEPALSKGIFMIARVPGLVAHIAEEIKSGEGLHRLEDGEIEFVEEK